ncbi:hypothetical protein FACS1894103_0860 [Campylobacterota bacterium]|nr:hypothetical protein FACS1894103_0860 [Campylobacterota bacterium]
MKVVYILLLMLVCVTANAATAPKEPKFTDYPAQIYKGAITAPKNFVKSDYINVVQINFAGRYYISSFNPRQNSYGVTDLRVIDLSTGNDVVEYEYIRDMLAGASISLNNQLDLTYEAKSALLMVEYYTDYDSDEQQLDNYPYRTVYFVFKPKDNQFVQTAQIDNYPADVIEFMKVRNVCEQFVDSYDGYDGDELDWEAITASVTEAATKSNAALTTLKAKYKNNKKVMQKLNNYDILPNY